MGPSRELYVPDGDRRGPGRRADLESQCEGGVDASIFPRAPGGFIQAPVFMMAERAADVRLAG